ncbi:MAG: hypothetical protein AB1393_00395 [Candidatus Edwardsbacteria bacterium]
MCFIGGIVGNLLALGLSKTMDILIRRVLPYSPTGSLVVIDLKIVLFTIALVLLIGFVSGVYPAFKAVRIRPIESIRIEL